MKILVVDDVTSARETNVKILRKAGHSVIEATNGIDGVSMAKQHMPDAIIMDIVMPGMDGFEATKCLRDDPLTRDILIVVVSTKDQSSDIHWAKKKGANSYLTKPVRSEDLLSAIEAN